MKGLIFALKDVIPSLEDGTRFKIPKEGIAATLYADRSVTIKLNNVSREVDPDTVKFEGEDEKMFRNQVMNYVSEKLNMAYSKDFDNEKDDECNKAKISLLEDMIADFEKF